MDFGDILEQWEQQTQKPYGKKRIKQDAADTASGKISDENNKTLNPMDFWLRRYGVYDKDAEVEETGGQYFSDRLAEKKRLRSMRPQAEIDLHGMTIEEAHAALLYFFDEALRKQYRKLLIIHGKGNHSQGDPVLTGFVKRFLEDHPHAGETGHPKARDGGSGSTWVLLK